ncbi:CLUMA_CG017186, isoform A [Clunio marinus]|uniref:CLUMA_CG017186, isoform A n=1 Tax=Clunio marinus TaxID=568069 RepID=A0A1J1IWK9_9DIPT|nr:CLUMA_CG017186, isoform A [Clunio marinus]
MPEVLTSEGPIPMADEPDFSIFENKSGLAEDLKFLASMPELCDVTFLVGETREPVCAVRAILASRSRVFQKMLYQQPSPQQPKKNKDQPQRETNKLRLFLKRSSEPLLNLQNAAQQVKLIIEEFEPDVFRQLIEYIHTGQVCLQPRTLLGVMNASDYYGLEELRRACSGFVQCCITVDTVCALLSSAERYIQYKCTKSLVQKVLEFVDEHGNEVLNLGSFTLLPQHVVRLILARDELQADEFTKFQAALMWSKKYCDTNPTPLKEVIGNFLEYIQFHKIPANVLMREVHPLGLVPYSIIMNALAYQADPASVDPGKLSPNSSRVRRALNDPNSDHMALPKIRKAKSQSFRTHRRSPSERRSPASLGQWNLSIDQKSKRNSLGQRSPGSSIYECNKSPSPSSQSQRSPLSRQGTVRASHRRKNSMSQSLNLSGRRSPMPLDRSPSGRRSPNYLSHELSRSPLGFQDDRKSPTARSPTGRRSPLGFSQNFGMSITPTDRRSPAKEMVIQSWNERQKSPTSSVHFMDRKSPVGLQNLGIGSYYNETRRSPINQLPIPPITISNPSETCALSPKSIDSGKISLSRLPSPAKDVSPAKDENVEKVEKTPEKKEKTSVMKEILAFVRKPSKKATTRTASSRFAAAFSKSDNNSNQPLVRQSTFSNMPNASSRAGRTAVTKQMSYEPKISTKLKNVGSKMSLRLRRATESKHKDKKSSGDDISDMESSDGGKIDSRYGTSGSIASIDNPFELEIVHFEKVGQSHKKHEQIVEEESPNQDGVNEGASTSRHELDKPRSLYEELKRSIETLFENKEPVYENIDDFRRDQKNDECAVAPKTTIQCPTFEIEPPSRRASFDPPRSPFLENFRSLSDTDHDIPSGESFEVFESHQHRESSFEDRHSSMDTSFDISRYQSTSYDDQTSSFEIVESHFSDSQTPQPTLQAVQEDLKTSNIDLSKSSIEIVDIETFQKSTPAGRKSSLETHFDLSETYKCEGSPKSAFASTNKLHECFPIGMKAAHQASLHHQQQQQQHHHHHHHHHQASHSRTKSPILSNQTSSNYSSRDSYDSSSTFEPLPHTQQVFDSKNPFADLSKHHYPFPRKYSYDKTFLCIDKRCAAIFEPRNESPRRRTSGHNTQLLNTTDTSSGSEFEAPSPRRALSASPKHTFTFRIVMKKVESSPDELCATGGTRHQRERERSRRDSRRRKSRLNDNKGKSF